MHVILWAKMSTTKCLPCHASLNRKRQGKNCSHQRFFMQST